MNQTLTTGAQTAAAGTPSPLATSIMQEGGAVSSDATDIFRDIADTFMLHPGIVFLLGCIFVIVLLVIWDNHKRRKNG